MQIKILLFAALREIAQVSEFAVEAVEAISCEEAMARLAAYYPDITGLLPQCAVAKNGVFTGRDVLLAQGDELAVLPPASGG